MDRLKVLVVDDESRMRKLVRDFLVKSNFDVLEAGDREVLETVIIKQDVKVLYRAYKENLSETEQTVIRMRYGLFGEKEHTQREIAEILGISRSYVSRIEKRAVGRMREAFYEPAGKTL